MNSRMMMRRVGAPVGRWSFSKALLPGDSLPSCENTDASIRPSAPTRIARNPAGGPAAEPGLRHGECRKSVLIEEGFQIMPGQHDSSHKLPGRARGVGGTRSLSCCRWPKNSNQQKCAQQQAWSAKGRPAETRADGRCRHGERWALCARQEGTGNRRASAD